MKNKQKIVIIDNYDSFTYNLLHYLQHPLFSIDVIRNDDFLIEDIDQYDKIVLSPGPGLPSEAGLLKKVVQQYAASKSILGICLGLQAIAEVFGGKLKNLDKVQHGVSSVIDIIENDELLFRNMPSKIEVGRYHSWVMDNKLIPDVLDITAIDLHNEIMALRHKHFDIRAVQFHPESILTPNGKQIIANWLAV